MNATAPDESAWIREAIAGSDAAFVRLLQAHQQPLRAFLRRLCGNWTEADDIAQETFVFAWTAMKRFDPARSFRPWLFGIGWRKYREHRRSWMRLLRRERRAAESAEREFTPDPGLRLDLAAAAMHLPEQQRASVLLCLGYGYSHPEAAEILDIPLGTLKSHVARGREQLLKLLGTDDGTA